LIEKTHWQTVNLSVKINLNITHHSENNMEIEIDIYGKTYVVAPLHFHKGYPGDREQPAEPDYWEYELLNLDGTPADLDITEDIESTIQELLCA